MATFTEDDIITAVTYAIGNPSLSEYPDAPKRDALRRGLVSYSKYKPLRRIGSFTTVANQQQYDIASSYAYLVGVGEVFYGATGQDLTGFYGNVYDRLVQISELQEYDTISNEALRVIDKQSMGVIEASTRYETHMIDDATVALIPTPEDVRTIYFEYSLIKTVADLKENEYQDIVDFTFLSAASELASRRNKILQINEPGTGFVMFHSGKFLSDQVEVTRKRLMNSLGVNTLVLHG
jgi:hypothetical protein